MQLTSSGTAGTTPRWAALLRTTRSVLSMMSALQHAEQIAAACALGHPGEDGEGVPCLKLGQRCFLWAVPSIGEFGGVS